MKTTAGLDMLQLTKVEVQMELSFGGKQSRKSCDDAVSNVALPLHFLCCKLWISVAGSTARTALQYLDAMHAPHEQAAR